MALDQAAVQDAYRGTAIDRKMVFYGERLSPHQIQAAEGYVLYTGVPIARTGVQEYGREEVGLYGSGVVDVLREEAEVFDPVTITSFEGKIVTDGHPPVMLDESNVMEYIKGTVHNVRRGTGEESDILLADLMIYDPELNQEIREGKREISCGYYLDYEEGLDGQFRQRKIRGNHVAVVPKGRAGNRVAIKDGAQPSEKMKNNGGKKMAKKTLKEMFFRNVAKDADLEEVVQLVKAVEEQEEGKKEEVLEEVIEKITEEKPEEKANDNIAELMGMIRGLMAKLEEEEAGKGELEQLAEEGDEYDPSENEEEVTVVTDEDSGCDEEETAGRAMDSVKLIAKDMLPVLNAIPDAKARKKAKDALYKSLTKRQPKAIRGGAAADANRGTAARAKDAQNTASVTPDIEEIVKNVARYNAQYKGADKK